MPTDPSSTDDHQVNTLDTDVLWWIAPDAPSVVPEQQEPVIHTAAEPDAEADQPAAAAGVHSVSRDRPFWDGEHRRTGGLSDPPGPPPTRPPEPPPPAADEPPNDDAPPGDDTRPDSDRSWPARLIGRLLRHESDHAPDAPERDSPKPKRSQRKRKNRAAEATTDELTAGMDEGQRRFLKHCLILGTGAAAGWISHLGPALSHSIEAVSSGAANSWYGVGLGTAYTAGGWLIDVRLRDGTRAADVRTKTGVALIILVRAPFATALTALVLYSPGPLTTHL